MPVLRRSPDQTGLVITVEADQPDAPDSLYNLTEEGERFLSMVLGLHAGDPVRDKDLSLLIDRGWATLIPPEPEPAPEPAPPVPPPAVTVDLPPASSSPRPASSRHTRGREVALQVLYLIEQNPTVDPDEVERFLNRRLREPKLIEYTRELVEGVRSRQVEIDDQISSVAENWRLDRMAAIDRNILRLGAYEMHHCPNVPVKVAINEALELAKRYSTAQSSRFVNGLLDRLQNPHAPLPVVPPSLADYIDPTLANETDPVGTEPDSEPPDLPDNVTISPNEPEPEATPQPTPPPGRKPPLASRRIIGRTAPTTPPPPSPPTDTPDS